MYVSCVDVRGKIIDEIKLYLDDEVKVLKYDIAQLYYEKLPALAYTLDEVKKLSESIESNYKIGRMNEINTAIIGLPKDCNFTTVLLRKNNTLEKHKYEPLNEEDMKNEKFVIYPFGIDFNENEKLKACYEEIVKERDNYYKNKKSKIMDYNFYPANDKPFVRVKQK